MAKSNINPEKKTVTTTDKLIFDKINYQLMLLGIAIMIIGFVVMTMETGEYGNGFLGLTLGPILVVLGFVVEFFAIFYKSKKADGIN